MLFFTSCWKICEYLDVVRVSLCEVFFHNSILQRNGHSFAKSFQIFISHGSFTYTETGTDPSPGDGDLYYAGVHTHSGTDTHPFCLHALDNAPFPTCASVV